MSEKEADPKQVIRVLICDCEIRTRQALKALLLARALDQGITALPAIRVIGEVGNGSEAVELVKTLRPEVVLLDARLPELDGMTVTRFIKSSWPKIKVVMLTMNPDHRKAALSAGVDAFLLKGCLAEALFDAILINSCKTVLKQVNDLEE